MFLYFIGPAKKLRSRSDAICYGVLSGSPSFYMAKKEGCRIEIISLVDVSKVNGPYRHQELRPGHLWNLNGI